MNERRASDVDAYIEKLPAETRKLTTALREVILSAGPGIHESIKWNIPFYTYKGLLCYINPAKKHVNLGLCRGAELSNSEGLLTGDGKEVRHVVVHDMSDIRKEKLRSVIHEAMMLNELKSRVK